MDLKFARLDLVRRLSQLANRVAREIEKQPISTASAFTGTVLERYRRDYLVPDAFGRLSRHFNWGSYRAVRAVMTSTTPTGKRIVQEAELRELDRLFIGYLAETSRRYQTGDEQRPLQSREAMAMLERAGAMEALRDPDALKAFVLGSGGHNAPALTAKERVDVLLALHRVLFGRHVPQIVPQPYVEDYRTLVCWWGAWQSYLVGNRSVERGFARGLRRQSDDHNREFILRRLLTHKGHYSQLNKDEITRLAADRPKSSFVFDPGHSEDGRRMAAMLVLSSGHDGFDATSVLNNRSPFEVLEGSWRRQFEVRGYAEGAATALASYGRALIRAGELEKASLALDDGFNLLGHHLTDYGAARLDECAALLRVSLYRETGDVDMLQQAHGLLQKSAQTFELLGNTGLAQEARRRAARLV